MKRFLVLAGAVAALAFPAAINAAQGADIVHGPACGNITLEANYSFDTPGATSGSATASSLLTTSAPSCAKVTYAIYYFNAAGTTQLASCSYLGDGGTQFGPCNYTSPTGDPLCIYATSTGDDDNHIIDTAPNDACASFGEPVVPGPSGATSFH